EGARGGPGPAEPNLLEHPDGGDVGRVGGAEDAVEAGDVEGVGDERPGDLGRVAAAGEGGQECVQKLRLGPGLGEDAEAGEADGDVGGRGLADQPDPDSEAGEQGVAGIDL